MTFKIIIKIIITIWVCVMIGIDFSKIGPLGSIINQEAKRLKLEKTAWICGLSMLIPSILIILLLYAFSN